MEAGWFADPAGAFEMRYHDGDAWTEHVANNGVQARSPVSESFAGVPALPVHMQQQEPTRPQGVFSHGMGGSQLSSSRQQLNVLLLVVVLVVFLGSCAALVGG